MKPNMRTFFVVASWMMAGTKVGEEALEAVIEATNGTNDRLIYEASDMFYHLIVLLTSKGLRIEDIAKELQVRHDPNWHKH